MDPTSRSYTGDDLTLVLRFLSECVKVSPPQAYWHPGDFVWTLYQNTAFDATRFVRLWEDDAGLAGVAILEEPDNVIMQVRPDLRGTGLVEREMLLWAAESLAPDKLRARHTELVGVSEDPVRFFLESVGFVRDEEHYLNMHRLLDDGFAPDEPLDGCTVRSVGAEDEWQRRVDLHREVWNPSKVTLDAYRRLRDATGYDPDLDLVAVNEDSEFASYCICWYDEVCRVGLFEPVGTSERFRRMGLGRAIMYEGLSRLAALGAESAFVTSAGGNEASRRLYESVGFRTAGMERLYGVKTNDLLSGLPHEPT